jgi:hypothetical protein
VATLNKLGSWTITATDTVTASFTGTSNIIYSQGVSINKGVSFTITTAVTLDLGYTGAVSMQFSRNGTTWTAWKKFKATRSFTLPARNGIKTVYVRFKDSTTTSSVYSATIILDTKRPRGTVTINGGAATTTDPLVTLTLTATDANGVTEMQFSTNNKWSGVPWEPFAPTISFDLGTSIPGKKRVYVRFKDAAGKISAACSDSIKLVAP